VNSKCVIHTCMVHEPCCKSPSSPGVRMCGWMEHTTPLSEWDIYAYLLTPSFFSSTLQRSHQSYSCKHQSELQLQLQPQQLPISIYPSTTQTPKPNSTMAPTTCPIQHKTSLSQSTCVFCSRAGSLSPGSSPVLAPRSLNTIHEQPEYFYQRTSNPNSPTSHPSLQRKSS
jgi:hypothetical protein